MGLPKSLIAKYGISKKAWSVYRDTKRISGSKKNKRSNTTMAKHKGRKSGNSMNDMLVVPMVGAGYGLIRQPLADMIPDFMGAYSDNIVLGLGSAGIAMFTKGTIRKAAITVLGIESFIATSKVNAGVPVNSAVVN